MNFFRNRLSDVVDAAGIGIAQFGLEGRIEDVNVAFAAMLRSSPERLVGVHWTETILPADHALARAVYKGAHQGIQGYFECRGLRKDGTTIDQAVNVVALHDMEVNEISGYFCVRQNLTAHRMAQTQFALAVDLAPVGVLILDHNGTILMVNKAIEQLFGYHREELISAEVEKLLPTAFRPRHSEYRKSFIESDVDAMAGRDLFGRRSDGAEIPVQVYLNLLDTSNRQVLLCTVIDIKPRLRYEEQLEKARQAAELANRAKSDFLARMSHEIRTPMNLIMGMNSLLLETPLTPLQKEYLEISHRNVRRLVRLTNGILDLSKVESGMLTLESRHFDLTNLVSEALSTMSIAAEGKGLALRSVMDLSVPRWWEGDAERITQILLNLVGNSIKFTDKGTVTVTVSPAQQECRQGICFHIDDTGCGVAAEQEKIIFEAFQQADSALNRKFEGTGLGLTICRSLCQLMGGDIEFVKKASPGMLMKVTIFPTPSAPPQFESSAPTGIRHKNFRSIPPGLKILLAEDNPENAYLVRAYLEGLAPRLEYAEDGGQAVEMATAGHYDLILMDIQMPVLDGYEATRRIRLFKPDVPIIALTAHALVNASADALRAGCNGYVSKPVEQDDLIESILQFVKTCQPAQTRPFSPHSKAVQATFLQNRRKDSQRIHEAMLNRDFEAMKRIGHDCKGCASGYGFPEIGLAAAGIESSLLENQLAALDQAIQEFSRVVEEACAKAHIF